MQACKSIPAAPALARSGRMAFSFKRLIFKDFIDNILHFHNNNKIDSKNYTNTRSAAIPRNFAAVSASSSAV